MCSTCHRLVGVHVWNQTWSGRARRLTEGVVWKVTRHHDGQRSWCSGSGYSVPEGAVIPVAA